MINKLAGRSSSDALVWLDGVADFMDNRFSIPFTRIRFGVDFILGLFPYVGDVISFVVSGVLIVIMARYGASRRLIILMLGNIWIDGMFGTIPFLGDIFDLGYKANRRNVNLMLEYYEKGEHQGKGWGIILFIIFILFLMLLLSVYIIWQMVYWIVS
jgi:hypothetical protein